MNKKFLFNTFLLAGAVMFAACDYNEDNFEGLSDGHIPSDVKKLEYTMTPADYQAVAKNRVNIAKIEEVAKADSAAYEVLKAKLAAVGKYNCFNDSITPAEYLVPVLAEKYYMADNGSAVKVSYENELAMSEELKQLNQASTYKVSDADYEAVWEKPVHFFSPTETPAKHLPSILSEEFADAVNGEMVFVDYDMSDSEPAGEVVPVINEPFDGYWEDKDYTADVTGWMNVVTKGTYAWTGRTYDDNKFLQASAFNHQAGESEAYMITPQFTVENGMVLSFDASYNHFTVEGGRLTVLLLQTNEDISGYTPEQIAAAEWIDINDALNMEEPEPQGRTDFKKAYEKDLSAYAGEKVYVAFRYNGDSQTNATAQVRFDNVLIKGGNADTEEVENVVTSLATVYAFANGTWKEFKDAYVMTKADFSAMGTSNDNFSSSMKADNYLPLFLANKYPYAQSGKEVTVAYKYYSNKKTTVRADEYVYNGEAWVKPSKTETLTDQFVLNAGVWKYDPSTVIELLPSKNPTSVLYYQTATDWVWENIDVAKLGAKKKGEGYVSHYGNNEYYSGCSAHYGNVDMRVAKARDQYAAGYDGLTDEEVIAKMEEHLVEVMKGTLEKLHSDVAPIEGIDVIFTIKMAVFTGVQLTDCNYEMKYKVVGPGTFEYVEDSYQPLAK